MNNNQEMARLLLAFAEKDRNKVDRSHEVHRMPRGLRVITGDEVPIKGPPEPNDPNQALERLLKQL